MAARNNQTNETWPSHIRDAAIIGDHYLPLKFSDQFWSDMETFFELLEERYNTYIEEFEKLEGKVTQDEKEKALWHLELGRSEVCIRYDMEGFPIWFSQSSYLDEEPLAENEICVIVNAIIAIGWRDSTDRSILKVRIGREDMVNCEQVNGLQALALKLLKDNNMIDRALSGANIQKVESRRV